MKQGKHKNDCTCTVCQCAARRRADLEKQREKFEKAKQVIKFLGIPLHQDAYIDPMELRDIFFDDEKLKVMVAKIRNKAFW